MNVSSSNRRAMALRAAALLLSATVFACADTGVTEVSVPLSVAGASEATSFEGDDGWQVALERVDVAFGPLYICGGRRAGHLCETARAEWTGSVVVDALDDAHHRAGLLEGRSGAARSWMYDHGIAALLTQQEPLALDAAMALGGSSVVAAGRATRDAEVVDFYVTMPIRQEEETETGVPVVRKSDNDFFSHDLTGTESMLLVRFDVRSWFAQVDFTAIAEEGVEGDVHTIEPGGQAHRAIRNAVVAGERPSFEWNPRRE